MPLSAIAVKNARPQGKPYKLADQDGLYLLVTATGSRLWRFDYRHEGKRRTLAIGKFPATGLGEARDQLGAARALLAKGQDPSKAKRARRGDDGSFEKVARRWFEANKAGWSSDYAETILNRLERNIFPEIGKRPIAEIDEAEMLRVIRIIERRGAVEAARRINNYCSSIFRFAKAEGAVVSNPTSEIREALQKRPPKRRRAALRASELPTFLSQLADYDGDGLTKLALRLTILTMVRTTETRFARWTEFEDLEGREPLWRIPADRMKMRSEHVVPLSHQAVDVIRQIRELQRDRELLFAAPTRSGVSSENTMLFAMYRMGYHGRATVHGFRGTASTILNEEGFNSDWIERQLAHVERDEVRGAYNVAEYLPGRRQMLQWWADYLDQQERVGKLVG